MKKLLTLALALIFLTGLGISYSRAQTADEIIDNYFENTGGYDNWKNLKGIKIVAKVNQGGMEIPLEIVQLADGRQYTKFSLQGLEYYQNVFDGSVLWSTNFQTNMAEKSDEEMTKNFMLNQNDFPEKLFDYKDKGYTVELMGTETVQGTETFKLKVISEPAIIDGKEVESITYYYFETENFVPIVQEQEVLFGPQAGIISQTSLSDYQEVDGLYFPFSMTQGVKDGESAPLIIESIEINPTVDDSIFIFPEG
ncbi:MAG: outer membrane lipoprotein-sorting protein [Bacteroidetes bacterium]|nr:outer membrane lipoprotein-sorting protein [Bacteroidota bacterium]